MASRSAMRIASCFIGLAARATRNAHTRSAEKSAPDARLAAQDQQRAFCYILLADNSAVTLAVIFEASTL